MFTLRIKVRISFGVKLLPTKNIIYLRTHFKSKLRFFEIIGPNIYKSLSQVLSRVGFFNVLVNRIYNYFLEQNQTDILKGVSAYNNSLSKHDLDTELINFGHAKFENVTKENLPRLIFSSKFCKGIKVSN